jgi:glycosyltransferase involved in cell wall biosynthesis
MLKKKICHFSTAHNANSSRLFDMQCKRLSKAGYDVTLIALEETKKTIEGVKIISFPKTKYRFYRVTLLVFYMLYKTLRQKSNLYHFHDPELFIVGYILKLLGKKVIYDVHEDLPKQIFNKTYIPKKLVRIISKISEILENFFCKRFDGILTVVPSLKKRFLKINKNTILFRNFPDIHLIDNAKKFYKNHNTFSIIYPGSLSKDRGIEDAINIVELYKGKVKLILAGSWSSQAFEKYCKELNGWKYVRYIGRTSPKKIYSYIKSADLGIHLIHDFPTSRIGYPMKGFEFMACELPFLMSDIGHNRKLFNEVCEFVKPGNVKDIKNKIDYLMNNRKKRIKLGRKGRKKLIKSYNLDIEFEKLIKLYSLVLNKN